MLRSLSPRALGLIAALFVYAIDQAHKYWMLNIFDIGGRGRIGVTPFFDLVLSWNRGVSYSFLADGGGVTRALLLAAQAAIVAGLAWWLFGSRQRWQALALGLIIGGALGNMFDRLARGAVADFFYLHTDWPVGPLANYVFNIADVGITAGAILLILEGFFGATKSPTSRLIGGEDS